MVSMVGVKQGGPLGQGHWVDVWGIPEPSRAEVRAWQVRVTDRAGSAAGTYLADRLIPLTVAFLLPLALITLVFLAVVIVGLLPEKTGGGTL
jgi:hypothetical protein